MLDFIMRLGVRFTDEEKAKALSMAHRMAALANITKNEGILALESELVSCNDYMKIGSALILNGTPPDILEKIFQHSIFSGAYEGVDLLERLIISEGLLAISRGGYSIAAVSAIVGSLLGEKYVLEMLSIDVDAEANVRSLIEEYTESLTESKIFEQQLYELTNLELSYALMDVNPIEIAAALKGCTKPLISHVRNGLNEDIFALVCRLFQVMTPQTQKDTVLEAQHSILKHIEQLKA